MRLASFLFVACFAGPVWGQSESSKTRLEASPAEYKSLARMSQIYAKVAGIDPLGKSITLELTKDDKRENPSYDPQRAAQERYRDQIRALTDPNPYSRIAALRRVAQGGANGNMPFLIVKVPVDYDLPMSTKVRLQKSFLTEEFDERGYLKKYTSKEIAALKIPGVPGYKARIDEIEPGQMAWIYMKPAPKSTKTDDEKAGRPIVTMVYVTSAPRSFSGGTSGR